MLQQIFWIFYNHFDVLIWLNILFLLTGYHYLFLTIIAGLFFLRHNIVGKKTDFDDYQPYRGEFVTYKGGLPIIDLSSVEDPYNYGYLHGQIVAEKMIPLVWRFTVLRWLTKITLRSLPTRKCDVSRYTDEISGLVDGYNNRVNWYNRIDFQFVVDYHLLPDIYSGFACTVLVNNTSVGKEIARNVDFLPLGSAGGDSYLLRIGQIEMLTVPGFIGAVSGWKRDQSWAVFLNVSHSRTWRETGRPICLVARDYLTDCNSVPAAINYQQNNDFILPTTSAHLTCVDSQQSARISFFQTIRGDDLIRTSAGFLSTFNYTYTQRDRDCGTSNSYSRDCLANKLFDEGKKLDEIIATLGINVFDTIHTVRMTVGPEPKLAISRDNGFAATAPIDVVR